MASPAYGSMTAATGGSGDTVTLTPPASLANNDILIAVIYAEAETQAVSPPTGFASFARIQNTGYPFAIELFWKRAASESGNYVFTETGNTWGDGTLFRVTGCITTETPIGAVGADNTGNSLTATALGITPTTNNNLICFVAADGDGVNIVTDPTSFTQRFNNDNEYLATLAQTTASAIGNTDATWNLTTQWAALMFELKSEATGGGSPAPVYRGARMLMGIGR